MQNYLLYVDPGSLTVLFQILIGSVLAGGTAIYYYIRKMRRSARRKKEVFDELEFEQEEAAEEVMDKTVDKAVEDAEKATEVVEEVIVEDNTCSNDERLQENQGNSEESTTEETRG